MKTSEAYARGLYDAQKEREPIFRSTRAHGIIPTSDDDMSDNWTEEMRKDYLEGYNSYSA